MFDNVKQPRGAAASGVSNDPATLVRSRIDSEGSPIREYECHAADLDRQPPQQPALTFEED